jgi:hypothetical protein
LIRIRLGPEEVRSSGEDHLPGSAMRVDGIVEEPISTPGENLRWTPGETIGALGIPQLIVRLLTRTHLAHRRQEPDPPDATGEHDAWLEGAGPVFVTEDHGCIAAEPSVVTTL